MIYQDWGIDYEDSWYIEDNLGLITQRHLTLGVGYDQYQEPEILRLRAYLQEKIQMGLLKYVHMVGGTTAHFHVQELREKTWERILVPGIEQYSKIIKSFARKIPETYFIEVRFEVKL